ncbi:MAG: DUF1697 domain-containing protein, partial [Rhodospirillales bacterium]
MIDTTFVILLRGVTPSGKSMVPMAPLRLALAKAGLGSAQTYIQSGNIIATSDPTQSALERLVHEVIGKKFGGDIAVVSRSAEQFAGILKRNPFLDSDGLRCY